MRRRGFILSIEALLLTIVAIVAAVLLTVFVVKLINNVMSMANRTIHAIIDTLNKTLLNITAT